MNYTKHGVTDKTPGNMMFGAGTVHKNLKFGYHVTTAKPADWSTNYTSYYTRSGSEGSYEYSAVTGDSAPSWSANTYYYQGWNFKESLLCATKGGNKLSITPNIKRVEPDGALVAVKGLDLKRGETAKLEVNMLEVSANEIAAGVIGKNVTSDATGYNLIESKADIEDTDYSDNIAYVGNKTNGTPVIVILDNAIYTNGIELEGKDDDPSVLKATFECYADIDSNLDILPYHVYYPTPAAT